MFSTVVAPVGAQVGLCGRAGRRPPVAVRARAELPGLMGCRLRPVVRWGCWRGCLPGEAAG